MAIDQHQARDLANALERLATTNGIGVGHGPFCRVGAAFTATPTLSDTLTQVGGDVYGREELAAARPLGARSSRRDSTATCGRCACGGIVPVEKSIVLTA